VTAETVWFGLYTSTDGEVPRFVASKRYTRPEGKTELECLIAGLTGARNWAESQRPPDVEPSLL
jgi:hypothetical protein